MTVHDPLFEAILSRLAANRGVHRHDPALHAEARREAARFSSTLNRIAELAEALIAADLRRLAHWCYAWGFGLDPTLGEDPLAQQQVRANLALSAMLHPSLAAEIREDRLELLLQRLEAELALAQRSGADLRRVQQVLRRLSEAAGLPVSRSAPEALQRSGILGALSPLVWPYTLPRLELLGPITAFRLVLLDVPDAEVYPWLPETDHNWVWIWTSDVAALASWIRRKTAHAAPLPRDARDAIAHLEQLAGSADPDDEDRDRQLARALVEALSELHRALYVQGLTREEALVAAFLGALQGEPGHEGEPWTHHHNLPELLARLSGARHHRATAKALRAVEQLASLKAART